jgi:hypothetical protein
MAIWQIRFKDRFGSGRSIYSEQAWKPSDEEALEAIRKSFSDRPGISPTQLGIELLGIDEVTPDTFI